MQQGTGESKITASLKTLFNIVEALNFDVHNINHVQMDQ